MPIPFRMRSPDEGVETVTHYTTTLSICPGESGRVWTIIYSFPVGPSSNIEEEEMD